eukprot:TRINITY_DN19756_c0_g1_i1.p2 TRINITY_DN19756_c0_g1~~TRINITY_DN19756_c0_g1_i1.p2  ORF type:complete len:105 (+),score=8.36 TRINITY_DN19756_c0_g1_i1:174-488(+)
MVSQSIETTRMALGEHVSASPALNILSRRSQAQRNAGISSHPQTSSFKARVERVFGVGVVKSLNINTARQAELDKYHKNPHCPFFEEIDRDGSTRQQVTDVLDW